METLYRKVEIKSEQDLPKVLHETHFWAHTRSDRMIKTNIAWTWRVNEIDWYLQPVEPQDPICDHKFQPMVNNEEDPYRNRCVKCNEIEPKQTAEESDKLDSYMDLSSLAESEKEKAIKDIVELTSKPLLSAFLSFGLKTHIETMIINNVTKKEYVLTFETAERFRERFHQNQQPEITDEEIENKRKDFCLWYYAQSQPLDANKVYEWMKSKAK